MHIKNCIVFLAVCCVSAGFWAGAAETGSLRHSAISGRFVEIPVSGGSTIPVYSLAQDSSGFVWIGTDAGLFRHDGIRGQRFGYEEGVGSSLCNEHINVLTYDRASGTLYVGTDKGFCVYDNAGGFVRDDSVGPRHVKTVLLDGVGCWIGTTDGLFLRRSGTDSTVVVIPDVHIACACDVDGDLFFGSYGRLWRRNGGRMETVTPSGHGSIGGGLILAVTGVSGDFLPQCAGGGVHLFVGTEKGLFRVNADTAEPVCLWDGGPVKNFLYLPDGTLAAGTDYGLLLLSTDGEISVFRHEIRNTHSVPDNVIWAMMLDSDGGLWVGTDHGAALTRLSDEYDFVGVDNFGMTDGLDISSIVCAGGGHIFAAGMNGVLEYSPSGSYRVLKSDVGKDGGRLAHNKVRDLYFDGGAVWAASDGGLDRISGGRVVHYNIKESSGRYLSDWMYAVAEDSRGRLWTGAYDGGLFITSKSRLAPGGGDVLCDRHISAEDGLSGNIVLEICGFGSAVAVVTDGGVDIVDDSNFEITHLAVPEGKRTLSLASDGECLWVGTEAGVYALEGDGLRPISGRAVSAQSLVFSDGVLWLCDDREIWKWTSDSSRWQLVRRFENPLLSIAADSSCVFAGSTNGFYSMSVSAEPVHMRQDRLVITSLYLDNVLVRPGREYSGRRIIGKDMSLVDDIVLGRRQNSFALTFSSMRYPSPSGRFAYRLSGFYDEWQICQADTRAVFLNIPPGRYLFEVCHLDPAGNPDMQPRTLGVRVKRPWYSTIWAYLAYILIIGGAVRFAMYFRRIMEQLKTERAEKEKAQSIANSTVSRTQEFRETLSVIFGSRQVRESSSEEDTPDSKFIKEIADIVNRHLDDPDFSAAALCEESHWPAKQIYRKIKQLTGLSTVEFIRDIRLQKAASLLEQGRHSVTEIMYMSGFTTASYFSKCFKSRYGVTPSAYQSQTEARSSEH